MVWDTDIQYNDTAQQQNNVLLSVANQQILTSIALLSAVDLSVVLLSVVILKALMLNAEAMSRCNLTEQHVLKTNAGKQLS